MVIDLTYLREATDGNKELIAQLVGLFEEQVTEFEGNMRDSLKRSDAEQMRKVAHKAKGSISALGMTEVKSLLQEIEDLCIGRTDIEDLQGMQKRVDVFVCNCRQALEELNSYLDNE